MRKVYVIFLLVLIPVFVWGQKCRKYHEKNCFSFGYPFEYSPQSRNLKLICSETYEYNIMVMAGYEYNFALAFDDLLGDVIFQITDLKKEIIYYNSTEETENKYDKQFAVDETKKLKVVIKVPKSKIRSVMYGPPRCGGLLIELNRQPNIGF